MLFESREKRTGVIVGGSMYRNLYLESIDGNDPILISNMDDRNLDLEIYESTPEELIFGEYEKDHYVNTPDNLSSPHPELQ